MIAFNFTDEQEQFRDVVRRFLTDKSPTTDVRRLMATDDGYDRDVWRQLSDDLGLPAVHIPEAYGGQGFSFVELGIVMEEMGRALLCAPYFSSTVLAASALLNGASEDQKSVLLPKIASGQSIATLAFTEANGAWGMGGIEMKAQPAAGGYTLSGEKCFVLDGHIADLIVVAAEIDAAGLSLFAVDGDATGIQRRLLETVDPTRKLANVAFQTVEAELLGTAGEAGPALQKTMDQAATALANEMVGGAQALLDSAIAYAQMRMQFGRAIGSFQAIKHKCADMLLEVELAKSAAYYAAQAAAEEDEQFPAWASLAKASAADTYMQTAASCIQIHGGIGFTWDNDTHLWFKRAKGSEVYLGDATYHRELLMQRFRA